MYLLVYIRKSNTNMHRYYSNSNLVYVLVENNIDCGDMHMRIVFRVVIYMYVMSILYMMHMVVVCWAVVKRTDASYMYCLGSVVDDFVLSK